MRTILKVAGFAAGLMTCGAAGTSRATADENVNTLTRSEELSGWELLFDGESTDGWRNYKKDKVSGGWKIADGALVRSEGGAGDIITDEQYEYFELSLDYKISKEGNSGVMFHVQEGEGPPWRTGPEIQVQDNVDGHDPQKAGWLYQLYKPPMVGGDGNRTELDMTRPAGEWNQLYLKLGPTDCMVAMNGARYFSFRLGDDRWKEMVSKSKFAKFPGFGAAGKGHICLQDHGDEVAYRNIKIRKLDADGSVPQPIDGTLSMKGVLAFPEMQFEGWDPIDEGGNVRKLRILELTYAPDEPGRLYAVAQNGIIYTFENRADVKQATVFLDLSAQVSKWFDRGANEQGLLGLAMHPKFTTNGEFFVYYTRLVDDNGVVSRFKVNATNKLIADRESEQVLLDIPEPFKNHNGGSIEFGPDGFLYVGLGDGGYRNDPLLAGQDTSTLLGSILRIDVDSTTGDLPYGIPGDNPFVNVEGARPEIYAFGLRNPWRISFDQATGRMWTGDVGQELWEEVDVITKGGNYGWSSREGTHPFGNKAVSSDVSDPIEPVWEYDHGVGKSITGGRVYRGPSLPALQGKYVYADYVSGSIWALTYDEKTGTATRNEQLVESGIPVLAFGQDAAGEVYYMIDSSRGECIYRFQAE